MADPDLSNTLCLRLNAVARTLKIPTALAANHQWLIVMLEAHFEISYSRLDGKSNREGNVGLAAICSHHAWVGMHSDGRMAKNANHFQLNYPDEVALLSSLCFLILDRYNLI